MKRIISLVLICAIMVVSLTPKVSAAETDSYFIDLLDLCLPNDSNSTCVYRREDGSLRSSFSLPEAYRIRYIDILFSVPSGATVNGASVHFIPVSALATSLTCINVSGNLYRAFGHVDIQNTNFYFWVDSSANYVTWESVRISTNSLTGIDEVAFCEISAYEFSDTITFRSSDKINHRYFDGSNDPTMNMLNLWIWCDNWRKYDFLDFILGADVSALSSIVASLGDTVVPCQYSFLDNGGVIENHYTVSVRLDLRDLDRTSSEGLILHIEGQVNSGSSNFISMDGCRGFTFSSSIDSDVFWFRRIYLFLRDDFYFNIRGVLESILASLAGDSSSGDAFKEESSGLISDLNGISSSMDSVERPSMDSINADFTSDISDASILMAGLFTQVTNIPWLTTILLASCTLGLISYILYGKE